MNYLSSGDIHNSKLQKISESETMLPMVKKEKVPNNLFRLRKGLGLTQAEFGKPLHKNGADISRYENGSHLTLFILSQIKDVYGFTWSQMLDVNEIEKMAINPEMDKDAKIKFLEQTVKRLAIDKAKEKTSRRISKQRDDANIP